MTRSRSQASPAAGHPMEQVPDFPLYRARAHSQRQMAINAAVRALWRRVRHPGAVTERDARLLAG